MEFSANFQNFRRIFGIFGIVVVVVEDFGSWIFGIFGEFSEFSAKKRQRNHWFWEYRDTRYGGSIRYTLRYTEKSDISAFDNFSIWYDHPWTRLMYYCALTQQAMNYGCVGKIKAVCWMQFVVHSSAMQERNLGGRKLYPHCQFSFYADAQSRNNSKIKDYVQLSILIYFIYFLMSAIVWLAHIAQGRAMQWLVLSVIW